MHAAATMLLAALCMAAAGDVAMAAAPLNAAPSPSPFVCPPVSFNVTALQRACATQASACTTCAAELAAQYGPLARASSGAAQPTGDEVQSCVFSLVVQLLPAVPVLPAVLACALPSHAVALNAWTGAQAPDFHIDSAPQVASLAGPTPQATPQTARAPAPSPSAYATPPPAQSNAPAMRPRGLTAVAVFTALALATSGAA